MWEDNDEMLQYMAHGADNMRGCTGLMCFDDQCQATRRNVFKYVDSAQDTLAGNFGLVDDPNPANLATLTEKLREFMPSWSVIRLQRVLWPSRRALFNRVHQELPQVGLVHAWGALAQPAEVTLAEGKQLPLYMTPQDAVAAWDQDWLPAHQAQILFCNVVAPLHTPIIRAEGDHWADDARAASALILQYDDEPRRIICATEAQKMPDYLLTLSNSY